MQRVSFVRLTAESSSVLDGEETGCHGIATHKSNYTALQYVTIALNAPPFLNVLNRHLITYPPGGLAIISFISDEFNQDGLKTPTRSSSVDDPCLWQGKEASDRASTMPLPVATPFGSLRVGRSPTALTSKIDTLIVSLICIYVDSTKATITTNLRKDKAILRSLAGQSSFRVTSNVMHVCGV